MKIALIGYGKMGKAIEEIALTKGHEIVLKINSSNLADFTKEHLKKADVAIEFSRPELAFENIKTCLEANISVVCGTTSWWEKLDDIKEITTENKGAFLYASNFSIGVNIFFEINKKLAQLMKEHLEYDVKMEEIHHTQKLDAPSGTAISLANDILAEVSRKEKWVNNKTNNLSELEIISKREDPAPGTHSILYKSEIDEIEIKHTAHSRMGFAIGAVLAAEFLSTKSGIYTMKDVLNI
ncbi:MAG: 4-hydroxy-tetrahydrodipicolinate reductase [Chitinophagaceae bacterium]|nr:4-hydroxy-tetrahydrodipicolinate reductase [Chitinophagaceae bacterium]